MVSSPNNSPQNNTQPHSHTHRLEWTPEFRRKAYVTIFYVVWAPLAFILSQFIAILPTYIIIFLTNHIQQLDGLENLLESVQQPGWLALYELISYSLAVFMVVFLPSLVLRLFSNRERENYAGILPKDAVILDDEAATQEASTPPVINAEIKTQNFNQNLNQLNKDLAPSLQQMGIQHLPTFIDIGLAPIAYVVYVMLARLATSLMEGFSWFNADQAQETGFGYFVTTWDRIFAMIALVFIAPVAEELIMRGWLYGKLRSKWGIAFSIILTSLVFAVLHGQWNVGVTVFMLSIVLCGLREITGTVWSGMLLHILSNGIAFYLLYIAI